MDEYDGPVRGHHFVIRGWDQPSIASVLSVTRRGADNFKRQARRLLIDAAVSLAHWCEYMYSEELDFEQARDVQFATKLGWRYTIIAVISGVREPRDCARMRHGRHRPPGDTVVYIEVQEVRVAVWDEISSSGGEYPEDDAEEDEEDEEEGERRRRRRRRR